MHSRYTAVMPPADKSLMVHTLFEPDLLARLDEYRWQYRFDSRSAAMKWLLRCALEQCPPPPDPSER